MKKLIYTLVILAFVSSVSAQWVSQLNPLGSTMTGKIQFVSTTEGWISLGNGKLLHTINGGNNWLVVTPEPVDTLCNFSDPDLSMCFTNPSTGWIIRTKGTFQNMKGAVVYKTVNSGVNWTKVTIPNYDAGFYIQFVDASNGWISTFNSNFLSGGIFRTTNAGTNWNAIYPPVGGIPFFINSNTGWLMPLSPGGVTTSSDSIRKTTNGGVNWTAPWGTNAQVNFNRIYFSDINNGWVVGKNGLILKTNNGGNSWSYITNAGINSTYTSKGVFCINANTGWIGTSQSGNNTIILRTSNGGSSWTTQTIPSNNDVFCIFFNDAYNGWYTADYGAIAHTTNGGSIGINQISSEVPSSFSLSQNYPNPFNPTTKIKFDVARVGDVKIVVYDAMGREVQTLVNESLKPGTYETSFDGSALSSGTYFYKLKSDNFTQTKKLTLLK